MEPDQSSPPDAPARADTAKLWRACVRLAGFCALWFVLTRGDVFYSWYIGLGAVVLATLSVYWIGARPGQLVRPIGLLRFVPYFISRSIQGGVDVASRAFRPSRPLDPALVDYELRLRPDSSATIAFVGVISLLPGTLCAGLADGRLTVHVVDRKWPIQDQLAELEARVAAVFGERVDEAGFQRQGKRQGERQGGRGGER